MEPSSEASTLSREVLRWIQSLDLAYSVKNVKRDFSNGFLIAEIFSRYYDKDIQMHSYDNGISMRIKKDNWKQLSKFFGKVGIEPDPAEVLAIIHCEDGAVVNFLNRTYETLTQRTVQKVAKRHFSEKVPPFARETGSAAIRNSLRGAVMSNTDDELSKQVHVEQRVAMHERSLQEERSQDPDRFSPTRKSSLRTPVAMETTNRQVTVKEIQVRQIDRTAAYKQEPLSPASSAPQSEVETKSPQRWGSPPPMTPTRDLVEVLSESLLGNMTNLEQQKSAEAVVEAFLKLVSSGASPKAIAAAYSKLPTASLAASTLDINFGYLSKFFTAAMLKDAVSYEVFEAAAIAFGSVGSALCLREKQREKSSKRIFEELFAVDSLPVLLPLLNLVDGMDTKRRRVLQLCYDFIADDDSESRIAAVATLQKALKDDSKLVFLHCVVALAEFDLAHFKGRSKLVDLHLYYVSVCLARPEPALHAGAAAALAAAVDTHPGVLASFLPNLALLAQQDSWWETQAQLVLLAAKAAHPQSSYFQAPEMKDTLLCLLHEAFHPAAPAPVKTIGLHALAPVVALPRQDPSIQQAFVDVLLAISDDAVLSALLTGNADLGPICGARLLPNLDPSPLSLTAIIGREPLHDLLSSLAQHDCSPVKAKLLSLLQ